MTNVYVSAVIAAPAADIWAVVRNFNALPEWTPFVRDSRIEQNKSADQIGCVRHFHLTDGGLIRERLLALSDFDMSCTYSILESPMAVENYIATLSLIPITVSEHTFAQWQADFDAPPDQQQGLSEQIGSGVFAAAFTALQQRFSR